MLMVVVMDVEADVVVGFREEAGEFGVAANGFRAALATDMAVEADDGVALRHDEVQVVRDHQHGKAEFGLRFVDDGVKAGEGAGVDAGGRFVEDDEVGFFQDGAGKEQALGFAAGEVLQAGGEFVGNAEFFEPRALQGVGDVVQKAGGGDGQVGRGMEFLRNVGHVEAVFAPNAAAARAQFAGHQREQGAFARAVGADDGEDFPGHDAQVDVM